MPHPGLQILLLVACLLWPLMRVYKRVGLSPFWALLLAADFLAPFLGLLLAIIPLAFQRWPRFPKAAPPPQPVKRPI